MKSFLVLTISGLLLASKIARAETQTDRLTGNQVTPAIVLTAGSANKVTLRIRTDECSPINDHRAGAAASLTFEPQEGLEIKSRKITYPEAQAFYLNTATQENTIEATIEVKAPRWPARSDYIVPAVLHCTARDDKGTMIPKSLAVTIPVLVYPREASHHGFNPDPFLAAVLIILLWPVLLFECVVLGNCWNC